MLDNKVLKAVMKASVILLIGSAMIYLGWLRWPDLIVDYGREVYVPWRLSEGGVLYRDIASFFGPFSAYWNSLLFRVFGPSILILELSNIALVAAMTYLVYRLFEREDDDISAVIICVAFLVMFALGKHFDLGSYNYIAPYSHEIVHGVFFSFLAIYMIKLYLNGGKLRWIFMAGLFTGLVALTKMETSLAVGLSMLSAFILIFFRVKPAPDRLRLAALFIGGLILPVLAFIGYLSVHMGLAESVKGVFSSWLTLKQTDIASSKFYTRMMGTDKTLENLLSMVAASKWLLIILLPLAADYLLRKRQLARKYGGAAAFVLSLCVAGYFIFRINWDLLFRPLPLFAALILAVLFFEAFFRRDEDEAKKNIPLFSLAVFSFVMLFKIMFAAKIYGNGFVLAMPATLLSIYMLLSYAPGLLKKKWGYGSVLRYSALAAIVVMVSFYFVKSMALYSKMDYTVGSGGDRIITRENSGGKGVAILLEQIEGIIQPGDDFVVMPEGALINYLSRRQNPSKYIYYLPSDLTMYGEDRMFEALESSPPDYIILISRDSIEYGYHYLGQDYGFRIFSFVRDRYDTVLQIGSMDFLKKSVSIRQPLGMVILKRAR